MARLAMGLPINLISASGRGYGGRGYGQRKLWLAALLLACFSGTGALSAVEIHVPDWGYAVNPPQGWISLTEPDTSTRVFTDPTHSAVFQVLCFPGNRFSNAQFMYRQVGDQLEAQGDGAPFLFSGLEAIFADLTFNSGRAPVRGYLVFINGEHVDYVLMSFSTVDFYEQAHDFLLSSLDSFSADEVGELLPGPVSQFYYPFPGLKPAPQRLTIDGETVWSEIDPQELEAAQVMVEREARILATYTDGRIDAWKRYYRMIYRDNYHRLDGIARLLTPTLSPEKGLPAAEGLSRRLLSWVQSFSYRRTGSLADLEAPVSVLYNASGDCDSRVLLYVILLHHLGIDSILLVSSRYSHSLAGVYVTGNGARIPFAGRGYLVAETTQSVEMGLIHRDMADPAGWIPVSLGERGSLTTSPAAP